jgi:hypothetical protein
MFYVGVDLGQKQDHTAIAIVERPEERGQQQSTLLLRRIQRVALGTPYPAVVEMVRDIANGEALGGRCALAVDGTGVGAPVVDMLRAAGLRCEITAVTITGGEREAGRGANWVSVPKKDLISGVQLALEKGELRIARRMKDAGALVRELVSVRMGEATGGEHDDLVIALALACWRARRRTIGPGTMRLF